MKSFFRNFLNYFHTIRYLKLSQINGRFINYFKRTKIDNLKASGLRRKSGKWQIPARRSIRMTQKNTFCFLNQEHEIYTIDDWNSTKRTKLWLYNLHYFDDLNSIDAINRSSWHHSLIKLWINENPPFIGNGWEPYPTSLRIVNWIKWKLNGNNLRIEELDSLAIQARYLSKNIETHILGNHLLANAKALIFAGLFFDGHESDSWYKLGNAIFRKELYEQILDDGGNFELSTMYHSIVLEDLLDIINLHNLYKYKLHNDVLNITSKMLVWLIKMCHPDGEISFFNDAALNNTPSTKELVEYAGHLGFKRPIIADGLHELKESGYSRVSIRNLVAIIDRALVGPDYMPGHAHADTLSFELSIHNQRVIVNSGTSLYGVSKERIRQRGTAAHSTVVINNKDSTEVWSGFRVARRANVFDIQSVSSQNKIYLSASHDGYKRLFGKPIHNRKWIFEESLLEVNDYISGKGRHSIDINFPLHPKINIISIGSNKIILDVKKKKVYISFTGSGKINILDSSFHPEFGISIKCKKIVYQVYGTLPIKIKTRIMW